jgi:hypothetical protein
MRLTKVLVLGMFAALSLPSTSLWGADVILNEYNAVAPDRFLNGGDASADKAGGRASDTYLGRIQGNGGDWFELVVIKDHLDMRGWQLDLFENGSLNKTLALTRHPIWSDLRSGTIITVAEDVPSDISYDPAAGDWWINVQARDDADGLYITPASFSVSHMNWQLKIRDIAGKVVFGPAGEGISPHDGIDDTEVFMLEGNPKATTTPTSGSYDGCGDFSTFGAPNLSGVQNFGHLRTVQPAPASLTLLAPNGEEAFAAGEIVAVRWDSKDVNEPVLVEFSVNGGATWSPVYPPNAGNSGTYKWLVPLVDSDQALIRVSSVSRPAVCDVSARPFVIVQATPVASWTGDIVMPPLRWRPVVVSDLPWCFPGCP